jgi:hypothetical protein
MRKLIGAILVSSPFWGLTVFMVQDGGWALALSVWGAFLGVVTVVGLGVYLLYE